MIKFNKSFKIFQFNNVTKIALITFFSSLYFYLHANFLYMQERGLSLFQANSIWAIIIGAIFVAEVPTGVVADRIGRKYSVVAAMALQLLGEVLYLFARGYVAFVLIAIIAGVGYLAIFIVTTFANSFALEKVIIAGDAATTAANVMASQTLFRLGIAGWIVVLMCDAVVAWALYLFFKPVQEELALLAAWMRLSFVVIFAAGLLHLFPLLEILSGAENVAAFERDQLIAQITPHLSAYQHAVHVSFVPFGLTILVLGYLTFTSGNMPRILGIVLMVAAAGYQIDSFGNFLSPAYTANETNFILFVAVPAATSEMWLTIWLLVRGAKIRAPLSPRADAPA